MLGLVNIFAPTASENTKSMSGNRLVLRETAGALESAEQFQTIDWWPQYRHDQLHTGYSTSKVPVKNQTYWIKTFTDWARSSPAVHNNVVFMATDENRVYAFNANTGTEIWRYTTAGDIVASPAVANGQVYIGSQDRKFYCLNETTGAFRWSYDTGSQISSSACVSGTRVVFGSDNTRMYCLNATTGALLWNYTTGGMIQSSPAVADGRVVFGSMDSKVYALNLTTGSKIWSYTTNSNIMSSPSVVSGKVYISSPIAVLCLRATDGVLQWSYTTGGVINSSPAVANGSLYIGCNDYKLYCLNASNGRSKWNYTTGNVIYSCPAIADGKVLFGSNDMNVYCLNVSDGGLAWKYYTGGYVRTSSPAVANKVVFIGSSYGSFSGKLFAFGPFNYLPIASNLTITPTLPVSTDNLVGHYDYYDEDGDPENGSEIRWYANDVLQPAHNDQLTVPGTATTRGQVWHFTVKPKDGRDFGLTQTSPSVTILNSPPIVLFVTVLPPVPYTMDNLTASYSYYDADGDPESGTMVRWFKNSILQPEYNDTLHIPHLITVKNEMWHFTVMPNDGIAFGTMQTSYSALIRNSLPCIDNVTITPRPAYANDTLTATPHGWTDADGDTEGYFFQWQKYETGAWQNITEATSNTLGHESFEKNDQIKILCTPCDSQDNGTVKEDTIIISNTPPVITSYYPLANVTISEGQSQEFNITKYDLDMDPLAVEWYVNGTKVHEASDSYVFDANFTSSGTYDVTAKVADDVDFVTHTWQLTVNDIERELAITSITTPRTLLTLGQATTINVTLENQGVYNESFEIVLYANTTTIGTEAVSLTGGNSTVIIFTWNTSGYGYGRHLVTAYAAPVPGETNITDNTLTLGIIKLSILGDVDGDFDVDILDVVAITSVYGARLGDEIYRPYSDLNNDGIINVLDVVTCTSHYGQKWP